MPVSRTEAQDALRDISRTERTSAKAYGYRHASSHLIVWGLIWVIGYGAAYARPQWHAVWPVLVVLGAIASSWIGWKSKPAAAKSYDWRYAATALAIFAFVSALFSVMPPRTDAQVAAFFPIVVALLYSLIGIWTRGSRMVLAGVAVAALTLIGYFLLPQVFLPWMAVVGGGALILGGFWLRTV